MDGTWTIVLQQGAHGSSGRTDRPGAAASCTVVGTLWLSHSRGRRLLQCAETAAARRQQRSPRTLLDSDFLVQVPDSIRQGALRLLADTERAASPERADTFCLPPLASLPRLLAASLAVQDGRANEAELALLVPVCAAPGGARPKVSIASPNGTLLIARFPALTDAWDVPLWEYVCLKLARRAGLVTPVVQLQRVAGRHVLLSQRFDRVCGQRTPFLSAMSLLQKQDGETASYTDITDALQEAWQVPAPDENRALHTDLQELWARMVFNMCICNTDDHLRNHGFLHDGKGWRLSPVYDLESSVPEDTEPLLHTAIVDARTAFSVQDALDVAEFFGLSGTAARQRLQELGRAVSHWKEEARQAGARSSEIRLMQDAFGCLAI